MAAKIRRCGSAIHEGTKQDVLIFECPGCGYGHAFHSPRWTWNGSFDKPTFRPSLLVNQHDPKTRCHSFVTDGQIRFLNDSHHALKGRTVDLPDWED
jgi:ribosomal protein L37E